jgi:hypothetical protein
MADRGFALGVSCHSCHRYKGELTEGTEDFALTETLYTIVCLVQTFEGLEYAGMEKLQPIGEEKQNLGMVLVSADGCWVNLRR